MDVLGANASLPADATPQKFAAVCNLFKTEHSLYSRANFKITRTTALSEWRGLCVA